jgi:predicted O-methyltransferase YrrM
MNTDRRAFLDELMETGRRHDAAEPDRLARRRNVEPETAAMLSVIVRAMGARRLLELGTSNGYSTIWLGDAAQATRGELLSLEIDPQRADVGRANVERAGLGDVVTVRAQDAAEALATLPDSAFDLVFLDSEREPYPAYWPDLVRIVRPGGLLAADNAISQEPELAAFRELVEADERAVTSLVPVGAGVLLIVLEQPRPDSAASAS